MTTTRSRRNVRGNLNNGPVGQVYRVHVSVRVAPKIMQFKLYLLPVYLRVATIKITNVSYLINIWIK